MNVYEVIPEVLGEISETSGTASKQRGDPSYFLADDMPQLMKQVTRWRKGCRGLGIVSIKKLGRIMPFGLSAEKYRKGNVIANALGVHGGSPGFNALQREMWKPRHTRIKRK